MSPRGILLVNLGSPDSPSVPDVRRYLREFLMDKRVLDVSYPIRFCIVHFGILPGRPAQSAEAYSKIWTAEGSPLISSSRKLQVELQRRVELPIELAMRYQNPSIQDAILSLRQKAVNEVLLIPMFPHYAMSSYETTVAQVREVLAKVAPEIRLRVLPPYYDHPAYIDALVASAEHFLEADYDHLLFSFHGVPERHLRKSDPTGCHCLEVNDCCAGSNPAHHTCYRAQCFKTVAALVEKTGLTKYSVSFQSRLGRGPWLKPYTDHELVRLAKDGVEKLLVICPAFVVDCLETIEEIGMRGREIFLEAGGSEFTLIPCLNDHPQWIAAMEKMISRIYDKAVKPSAPLTCVQHS